jgi:tRNA(adenine34) deaminase
LGARSVAGQKASGHNIHNINRTITVWLAILVNSIMVIWSTKFAHQNLTCQQFARQSENKTSSLRERTARMRDHQDAVHRAHMRHALTLARTAMAQGDWPVAAIIARGEQVLALGRGRQSSAADCLAHAEMDALTQARNDGTLIAGATLYCTMEPCPMCAWALHLSGIGHIVLGARHADLSRTDLGRYTIEGFADLMGMDLHLTQGVEHEACLNLRREWGRDKTRQA